jgi:serine/threonine protein kinase
LLESKDKDSLEIKISDFGFSCFFDPKKGLDLVLGSPLYMAPEIIESKVYNEKVDIWSIGIITYMLLTGRTPFPGSNKAEIKNMIVTKPINFNQEFLKHLSKNAIDFMQKALIRDFVKRYSAK